MQFSTKIDGFEQKDSQGFENSYTSYEQYPLEKFFIFTMYQNYTLALKRYKPIVPPSSGHISLNFTMPFKFIIRKFELFSNVWSENTALFERLMEIHSNPPNRFN